MKKLLIVLLAIFCVSALFAKSYSEYLAEAEKYESKKEWIYALGAYYNAMKASDNPEKASQKYKEISECIKAGNPGLGTFNVFSMHDEWVNLIKNSERYFTENFPYTIKYENLKYDSADYEKKTATYKLSLIVNKSDFYNAIIDILRTGYKKTDHKDWNDVESQYKTLWFMEDFYTGVHSIGSWESTNFTNTFTTSVYNTNYNKLKTVDEYENLKSDADRIYKNYGVALAYFASVLISYKYKGISVNETPAFAACFSAIDGVNNITLIDWYGETKLSVPIFKSGKKTGYDIKLGIYDNDNKLIVDGTRQTLCIDEFEYQFANISQDKMAILDSGNYHIGLIGIWLNYGLFDILSLTEDDFTNGTIRGIIKPLPDIKLAINNVEFIDSEAEEVGSYSLESMTVDGETLSMQDLKDMYTANGMDMPEFSLSLTKDGKGKLVAAGEASDITWDSKAKTMTNNGVTISYTFKDNKITLSDEGVTMVFVKK